MGGERPFTPPAQHPLTPPIGELSANVQHLVGDGGDRLEWHQTKSQLPKMAHEPYLTNQYGGNHYPEPHHGVGLGIQHYDFEQHSAQGYYPDHRSHTTSPYVQTALGSSSPPTPMSHNSDTRRTRSGRSIVRNDSPHSSVNRSSPSRSTRKKKASANDKHRTPKLTAPLSVLTKDMLDVPVRDMETWVKRSAEERMKEAEKRNGYITRPMNSFMLYRSAYAERTKMWCLHNNHQVVSSVSGESWPLEPPAVREFYNELAKIERINHQNAHPNYKFSPSKPGTIPSSKKRGRKDEEDTEPSDLDDPDWAATNGVRSRPSKRPGRDAGYPARANLGDAQGHFHEVYSRPTSAWDQSVRRPPVAALPYQQMPYPQHFYPSPTMQHHHAQMMMIPQHQQDPFGGAFDDTSFPTTQSLIGVPGGNHAELLGLPTSGFEHQVDPLLLGFDGEGCQHTLGHGLELAGQYTAFDQGFGHPPRIEDGAGGPLITDYRPKEWVPDSTSPGFEPATSEFDKLWDEHEQERRVSFRCRADGGGGGGVIATLEEQGGPVGGGLRGDTMRSPKAM